MAGGDKISALITIKKAAYNGLIYDTCFRISNKIRERVVSR